MFAFLCNLKAHVILRTVNYNRSGPEGLRVYQVTGDCVIPYEYARMMRSGCCVRCIQFFSRKLLNYVTSIFCAMLVCVT